MCYYGYEVPKNGWSNEAKILEKKGWGNDHVVGILQISTVDQATKS